MKKIVLIYFSLTLLSFKSSLAQSLTADQIYTKIDKTIVTIYTFDTEGNPLAQGSGVVLNQKGWVVTNYHVYKGAKKLLVKHRNRIIEYTSIISYDVEKDILILKIADRSFPSIALGNSDFIKVGQKIFTIGSPLGLENTITEGIVSGIRTDEDKSQKYIQISAPISPGSSGGALINLKGELVGITTLTYAKGQNLNFAIPINEVVKLYNSRNEVSKDIPSKSTSNNNLLEERNGFKTLKIGDKISKYQRSFSFRNITNNKLDKNTYEYFPADQDLYNVFSLKMDKILLTFDKDDNLADITLIKSYTGRNSFEDAMNNSGSLDPYFNELFGKPISKVDVNTTTELKIGIVWKNNKITVKQYVEDYGMGNGSDLKVTITSNEFIQQKIRSGF